MRKILALMVVLSLIFTLAACGSSSQTTTAATSQATSQTTTSQTPAQQKTITLAFSFLCQDATMQLIYENIVKEAEAYNAAHPETKVKTLMTNAEFKLDKQLADVDSLIVQKPDVISIIAVDEKGIIPAFEACKKAGIKTINALKIAATDIADMKIIGMDHYRCGQLQAEFLDKYLKDHPDVKLKIGYLNSDPAVSDVMARYQGYKENFLDKYKGTGRAEEVANTYAFWDTAKAMAVVEDWFQRSPDINCIIAMNDLMAMGAIEVCKAQKKECLIIGLDGIEAALEKIKEGSMAMTVYSDNKLVSKGFFENALKVAMGTQTEKEVNIGKEALQAVDKSNVDAVLK